MADIAYFEEAKGILEELLVLLELPATVQMHQAENEEDEMRLSLVSDEAARIIGKRGQSLEALELVLNRIMRKRHKEEEESTWVNLDVDGYLVEPPRHASRREGGHEEHRHSRMPQEEEERLRALALDLAREVKKFGKDRVIGPFSPAERRIIHVTLEHDDAVETVSDAEADANRGKKITIRLKNPQN